MRVELGSELRFWPELAGLLTNPLCVEIDGSHCGMAVNPDGYREVERLLERASAPPA
jgi:hypothetical protein